MKILKDLYFKPIETVFYIIIWGFSLLSAVFLLLGLIIEQPKSMEKLMITLGGVIVPSILSVMFILLPLILILYNLMRFFIKIPRPGIKRQEILMDLAIILHGGFCTYIWGEVIDSIFFGADWEEKLRNAETHTPIFTESWVTLTVIIVVAIICLIILQVFDLSKLPPLVIALSIGGVYLGMFIAVIWSIQTCAKDIMLSVYSVNIILLGLKTIRNVVSQWKEIGKEPSEEKTKVIKKLYKFVNHSSNWHIVGLISALPLLGIIIAILAIFGQEPDSIIRAWTETADWTLSQKVAPQNIIYDEHYLCTVAAGGHKKIVKPMRMGIRHGHNVIVNRQLCVANAFEQLLEEKIPKIHRVIRNFYDKYGYPITKHIKSPYIADVIWFIMKPLEWFFLIVLYLFDKKPENRIAVQYPHKPIPKM